MAKHVLRKYLRYSCLVEWDCYRFGALLQSIVCPLHLSRRTLLIHAKLPRDPRHGDFDNLSSITTERRRRCCNWPELRPLRGQSSCRLVGNRHLSPMCLCTTIHGCHESGMDILVHGLLGASIVANQCVSAGYG